MLEHLSPRLLWAQKDRLPTGAWNHPFLSNDFWRLYQNDADGGWLESPEERLILAAGESSDEITAAMLPLEATSSTETSGFGGEHLLALPLREAREAFERDYISAQLSRFGGNISKTAIFIGMERSALHRKIKSVGLYSRDEE